MGVNVSRLFRRGLFSISGNLISTHWQALCVTRNDQNKDNSFTFAIKRLI